MIEVIATDKELISFLQTEIRKMGKEISVKDRIIQDYEKQVVTQINHILELGKEIDTITEYAFTSPMMLKHEVRT